MSEFIYKAKNIKYMERAVRFAENQRAIGIGQLGLHSYYQSKMIAFESLEAKLINTRIAKNIQEKALIASKYLATVLGEPTLLKGYGRRNVTLTAIAPTKSSSFIFGGGSLSEGIEPIESNFILKDLAKGKFSIKNYQLERLLIEKNKNTDEVWMEILKTGGSVQKLDFLNEHEKEVFKTFSELSMLEVIIQAATRQKFICQSQSLNLMISPKTPAKDINKLLIEAWKLGVKTLYYSKSTNLAQEFTRGLVDCASCSA